MHEVELLREGQRHRQHQERGQCPVDRTRKAFAEADAQSHAEKRTDQDDIVEVGEDGTGDEVQRISVSSSARIPNVARPMRTGVDVF